MTQLHIMLTDLPDNIAWKWTADGNYIAKTTYQAQFKGSYCSFQAQHVWRAQVEGKHSSPPWSKSELTIAKRACG
uniref:Uncharacterized protein n=1 Tax=Setaria viridis TaxID=4556 RepID=A0A4U6ST12_SETVI|nr:hypothetical protein SEVIR_9G068400v2 [Setaria viridis]